MREKERRKKIWQIVFAGICLWLLCSAQVVTAKEIEEDIQITDELLDRLDMKEIEDYLKENEETEDISFLDLVTGFIRGNDGANLREAGNYLSKLLFSEFRENRQLLVIIVAMAASFALLKNFSTIFKNSYISDLCFVLVYIELMILVMKSFLIMH